MTRTLLLTTTSLVFVAGSAMADVALTGTAATEYNSVSGLATEADLTATMSAELDNGYTASASVKFATDDYAETGTTSGNISLSSDTVTLTFGNEIAGAAYSAVSDTIGIGAGEDTTDGVSASYNFGAGTAYISAGLDAGDTDASNVEFGASGDFGGMTVGLGVTDGDSVIKVGGAAAGLSYVAALGNVGGLSVWDVAVSYPAGAVTLGMNTDQTNDWEISAAYAEGAVAGSIKVNQDNDLAIEGSYDMGNGMVLFAGAVDNLEDTYIGLSSDLGGGASLTASYANDTGLPNADNEIGANDYAAGTTVGLSFAF